MIAPLRLPDSETTEARRRLRRAHRLVASTLLPERTDSPSPVPAVPAWQAWMVAVWVVVVTACYLASMLGLWH
jgi:hypothetical protein